MPAAGCRPHDNGARVYGIIIVLVVFPWRGFPRERTPEPKGCRKWLLHSDSSTRWQVLSDLTGEVVAAERSRSAATTGTELMFQAFLPRGGPLGGEILVDSRN